MNIRYHVELSQAERCKLTALVGGGKHYARKIKRAQILLAADSGLSDDDIAAAVAVGGSTVYRTKRRFVEGNLEAALNEEPREGADRKLTSNEEALLVATACSSPPEGRARWTLDLLAGAMVKLTDHDSLSRETVRRRLAENHLKPWQKDMWCIPKVDAEYVARMEDVLDLYAEQPDPKRPVVCFDESPTQLIGEARQPVPAAPGRLERFDYEYRRNGVVNLFVFLDAHRSWRRVKVTGPPVCSISRTPSPRCPHWCPSPTGRASRSSWEEALDNFGVHYTLVRIGLTRDQVRDNTDIRGLPLERLGIRVKNSDSRAASYIRRHGAICWEADILPGLRETPRSRRRSRAPDRP